MTGVLEARGLHVVLGGREVLRGVTVEARAGELTVVLGPNGSGKTTLLRTLAGLLRPSRGAVLLDGEPVHSMSPRRRARLIAYIPSELPEPGLGQLVAEFVAAGLYPLRRGLTARPSTGDLRLAVRALSELGGGGIAWQKLQATSSGERQRALIAHGLVRRPRVIVADEPTSFLDLAGRMLLYSRLLEEAHRGAVVVAATHDMILAALYATKLILLRDGQVLAEGRPEEVLSEDILERLYGVKVRLVEVDGRPIPIPVAAPEPPTAGFRAQ